MVFFANDSKEMLNKNHGYGVKLFRVFLSTFMIHFALFLSVSPFYNPSPTIFWLTITDIPQEQHFYFFRIQQGHRENTSCVGL